MTAVSSALVLLALGAVAHGGALPSRTSRPMVWPMPSLTSSVVEKPLIVGGEDAALHEFPHQVSMQVSILWLFEQHICGATIIANDWALTAAHCVKGVPWYASAFILAGKNNLGIKSEEGQQRSAARKMYTHEKYDSSSNGGVGPYDIGLLHLKTPLTYSDSIKPANLPVQNAIPVGEATLSGWGSTSDTEQYVMPDKLQKVVLPIIPFEECNAFIQRDSDQEGTVNPLRDTNVCVGDLTKAGQGSCNGDSGGPLSQWDSAQNSWTVIGATSWGYFPCQATPAPSVYTRVSAYVDWIQDKMANNK